LGHRNAHYAKQAGTYIYNMVTTILTCPAQSTSEHPLALWSDQEPKYFHFIEELLVPYERAMQSEVCDNEVQSLVSLKQNSSMTYLISKTWFGFNKECRPDISTP